jgi:hypothetical protein
VPQAQATAAVARAVCVCSGMCGGVCTRWGGRGHGRNAVVPSTPVVVVQVLSLVCHRCHTVLKHLKHV